MVNIETVRRNADKVFSGLIFVMAIAFFIACFSLPEESALLPRVVAIFLGVLDLPVIIEIWRAPKKTNDEKVVVPIYLSILVLLGYYLAMIFLGYIVSSMALVFTIGHMTGQKSWIVLTILAISLIGTTYYIFGTTFGIALPKGILFNMLFQGGV